MSTEPIIEPGIYFETTMDEYLDITAASAGVILAAYRRCPMAAQWEYSERERQEREKAVELADLGTIAHALVLTGSTAVKIIDPKDYPSKTTGSIPEGWTNVAIRKARDDARELGIIPILKPKFAQIERVADEVRAFIARLDVGSARRVYTAFQAQGDDAQSEVTVVWQEGDVLCKCRPDRLYWRPNDTALVVDLKFTSASAEPYAWGRQMVRDGHYTRAAWYERGLKANGAREVEYVFLVCELDPPYLCSLVGLDSHARELGSAQCLEGLRIWQEWRRTPAGTYGGYPLEIITPEVPPWEDETWARKQELAGIPYDVAKLFNKEGA